MRLLHVGSGFRPWRRGGLVAYIEDLMSAQARRGHEVHYLFSGRQYPFVRGPRLKRWRRDGIAMLEVVNSPLYDHGRQPQLELAEPTIERMLDRTLRELEPDAVHVQEFAGLPFSILDVIRSARLPTIVTLQDYFALCPMFKLFDADHHVCLRREVGPDCMRTTSADPRPAGILIQATLEYEARRLPRPPGVDAASWDQSIVSFARRAARLESTRRGRRAPAADAEAFQRRRDINLERLNRVDCVIAMSRRVAEIYSQLGVENRHLRTVELTLEHIERLRPRRASGVPPITFATLAGFESVAKGGELLLDALHELSDLASEGRFRLLALGAIHPSFFERASRIPGVELRGPYRSAQLDSILDEVDVGIVPSVWEEAYGYVGPELLAKGIPVVASAIGGIVDWMRDGQTGWLNRSCSAAELAKIMRAVIERPSQVVELNERLRAARSSIVRPFADHVDEMEAIYQGL